MKTLYIKKSQDKIRLRTEEQEGDIQKNPDRIILRTDEQEDNEVQQGGLKEDVEGSDFL